MTGKQPHITLSPPKGIRQLVCWIAILATVLVSVLFKIPSAGAEGVDQGLTRAIFLYNLTNFIRWPEPDTMAADAPFSIAVMGRDDIEHYLEEATTGELIQGRKVIIKNYPTLEDLLKHHCDLLFVSAEQFDIWPQIRDIVSREKVLTVSDVEGFTRSGGMVNLLTSGGRIQIEINYKEAKRKGFDISAKLLKLARIVETEEDD